MCSVLCGWRVWRGRPYSLHSQGKLCLTHWPILLTSNMRGSTTFSFDTRAGVCWKSGSALFYVKTNRSKYAGSCTCITKSKRALRSAKKDEERGNQMKRTWDSGDLWWLFPRGAVTSYEECTREVWNIRGKCTLGHHATAKRYFIPCKTNSKASSCWQRVLYDQLRKADVRQTSYKLPATG